MLEFRANEIETRFMENMKRIDRAYEKYAKKNGLNFMVLTILDCICSMEGSCTQKAICEETAYPKQSVNLVIRNLQKQGYIRLQESPEDRRNKLIGLTKEGEEYAYRMIGRIWAIADEAAARFEAEDCEKFITMLDTFTRAFSDGIERLMSE